MWHTSTRGFWSEKNYLIWVQIARQCFQRSTWYVLPRVNTNWDLNTLHLNIISKLLDRTTSQWNCQISPLPPPPPPPPPPNSPKEFDCPSLNIPGDWTLLTFSPRNSSSPRTDTWHTTDREGTMPSCTEPTLDQSIAHFNATKSSNYATPKWNSRIYLTHNLIETNTHGSTLHSMIRKQVSKIGLIELITVNPWNFLGSSSYLEQLGLIWVGTFSLLQRISYCLCHECEVYSWIYSIRGAYIHLAVGMLCIANDWIKLIFKRTRLGRRRQATIEMVCIKYLHYTKLPRDTQHSSCYRYNNILALLCEIPVANWYVPMVSIHMTMVISSLKQRRVLKKIIMIYSEMKLRVKWPLVMGIYCILTIHNGMFFTSRTWVAINNLIGNVRSISPIFFIYHLISFEFFVSIRIGKEQFRRHTTITSASIHCKDTVLYINSMFIMGIPIPMKRCLLNEWRRGSFCLQLNKYVFMTDRARHHTISWSTVSYTSRQPHGCLLCVLFERFKVLKY